MNNNPLRQYFRRPAVYLKLPSGTTSYSEDVINIPVTGELPIYPMTAIDEITARTPDSLFNGTAIAELIKSCVPDVKDPWAISSSDLDAILIAIKSASNGDQLDIDSICPKCNELSPYGISLVGILSTLKAGDYNKEFEVGDLKIKFRPLVYKEMNEASIAQFEMQKLFASMENMSEEEKDKIGGDALERVTLLTMKLLSLGIEYIETPEIKVQENEFILDFLKNCDRNTFISIREYATELKKSSTPQPLKIKCDSCGHEYEQDFSLNPSDFFG
jgi:hypothetical protein